MTKQISAKVAAPSYGQNFITIQSLAREALTESGGMAAEAVAALRHRLVSDEALFASVIEEAIASVAYEFVHREVRSERKAIVSSVVSGAGRAAVEALAAGVARSLLDFPLASGRRLADATVDEVEAQAAYYEAYAKDRAHKGRWLRAVASVVPPGRTVGSVLDGATVTKMFEEATNG